MSEALIQQAPVDAIANASKMARELITHGGSYDRQRVFILIAAIFCAFAPLEISQLAACVFGVISFLLLEALQLITPARISGKVHLVTVASAQRQGRAAPWHHAAVRTGATLPSTPAVPRASRSPATRPPTAEVRKLNTMPAATPMYQAVDWDAEIQELLVHLVPTAEGDAAVADITCSVERLIHKIMPDARVHGYVCGSIQSSTAFGAVGPEVDVVINISLSALARHMQGRWSQARPISEMDELKIQKLAIRACTDCLIRSGTFKFGHSAFRDHEPRVTIIALTTPAAGGRRGIPINLHMNASTPVRYATLFAECSRVEHRAKELILLVKRWAKDRGLCQAAAKGHITPYAWSLLAVYYTQVGLGEEAGLMPPLSRVGSLPGPAEEESVRCTSRSRTQTAGDLLKGFMAFYAGFDWRSEAVSVRLGKRSPPDLQLPIHIILSNTGNPEVGPSIEDPFKPTQNLGKCMTYAGFSRMREELARAHFLCSDGASLTVLLEPWSQPAADEAERSKGGPEADGTKWGSG